MDGITAETAGTNPMMLTYHAAQPSKVAFRAIDVDAIEETVGIGVIDPLDVESLGKLVPVRRLVGDESGSGLLRCVGVSNCCDTPRFASLQLQNASKLFDFMAHSAIGRRQLVQERQMYVGALARNERFDLSCKCLDFHVFGLRSPIAEDNNNPQLDVFDIGRALTDEESTPGAVEPDGHRSAIAA